MWTAPLRRYARWLHLGWPAGHVEPLPEVDDSGRSAVPGLFVVGDLTGSPLLKLAADSGEHAVRTLVAEPEFARERATRSAGVRELVIVGAGVSGMSAALAARRCGLDFAVFEAKRPFQTIADFPRAKPIYAYPEALIPRSELPITASVKEALLAELEEAAAGVEVSEGRAEAVERDAQGLVVRLANANAVRALRVILAVGRSGNFRKLGIPGEDREFVHNRLHDPRDFAGRQALVIGGGDSAVETAIALAQGGAEVVLSHRAPELSRPKPANLERLRAIVADPSADVGIERPTSDRVNPATGPFMGTRAPRGGLRVEPGSEVLAIEEHSATIRRPDGATIQIPCDVVFSMIGREPPLDLLRRSGIRISGDWSLGRVLGLVAFLLFCSALYDWKSGGTLETVHRAIGGFPFNVSERFGDVARGSLVDVLRISASTPSFWYTLAYSGLVVVFGFRRIRRRRTAYVRAQTLTLIAIQVLPLFLLPEIVLPWLDANGHLPPALADPLFPRVSYGHGREFWRAYGFILAWPLNVYNVLTPTPLPAWLAISGIQTFVLIPVLIFFWGKGAYCGWICSCGALAETLGDTQRHKMPHGPGWNRLNLAGQGVLGLAVVLAGIRFAAWSWPGLPILDRISGAALSGSYLSYKWVVDVFLAGVLGYGAYFWFSGRVWCRFFCPLAALMHVYARFSRFRIFADKKKCISCNVCTSVCHQGIDVMNFANKGLPMADPECVRCSACVAACPTDVLAFGRLGRAGEPARFDRIAARSGE